MSGLQVRVDVRTLSCGHQNVAWGIRATHPKVSVSDELWLLYSLEARDALPEPRKYGHGVTHELTAYSLDGTRIDFACSLWEQKQLIPELPAQVAFQFVADGDHHAMMLVQDMMTFVMRHLKSIPTKPSDWLTRFPDSVTVPHTRWATADQQKHVDSTKG